MDVYCTEYVQTRVQCLSQYKLLGPMHNERGEAHPALCRVTDQSGSLKQANHDNSDGITLEIYIVLPCRKVFRAVLVVQNYFSSSIRR